MHMPAQLRHANVCACSYHWILLDIKVEEGKVELLDSLLKKKWLHHLEGDSRQVISIIINYISAYLISSSFPDINYLITPLFIFFATGQGLGKVHQGDSR